MKTTFKEEATLSYVCDVGAKYPTSNLDDDDDLNLSDIDDAFQELSKKFPSKERFTLEELKAHAMSKLEKICPEPSFPTMFMPIVQEIVMQKFRVSIFSSGSSTLLHDAVESAISHLAVRQKYLDQGYAAHQLQIMRVYG